MPTTTEPLRFDAKLGSVARTGRTAMICFYVRGEEADIQALYRMYDADLVLGVVPVGEVAADDGVTE